MLFHLLPGLLLVIETCGVQGLFVRDHRLGGQNMSGWPYFETNVTRNVTTAIGQTAFLHCRVHQRSDKEVSWMRKRDMHILSTGISTYTSDLRFQVIHPDKSENWTLQIKSPQKRDSGTYECQVSTEPKMSLNYTLTVVEARARILGKPDLYIKTGSSLTLTCLMSQGPHDLGTVAWYRDNQPLDTSTISENDVDTAPRITVETEWSEALTSRLSIVYAKLSDSGNYSCVPTFAEMATVKVHVINAIHISCITRSADSMSLIGILSVYLMYVTSLPFSGNSLPNDEHPAAMQHGNTAAGSPTSRTILVTIAFLLGQLR